MRPFNPPSPILRGKHECWGQHMDRPRVFADFHNADSQGRLRLNCVGTVEDLAHQGIALREGLWLRLYSEGLEVDGFIQYSTEEHLWVAVIGWDPIKRVEPESIIPEDQAIKQRKMA